MIKKIQPTIFSDVAPTTNETVANGYQLGQWWQVNGTGVKYYHKTDGVWVLIAWSDLLNTISHNQLLGLDWLSSGHTGNANKIFGSDGSGNAKEYALTDFGGAKRLVLLADYIDGRTSTAFAIHKVLNATLILTTSSTNSFLYKVYPDGGVEYLASVATANGAYVVDCSTINEFHVICNLAGTIYRVSYAGALLGTISIEAQTSINRAGFCTIGNYEYYSSGANGVTLNQRNLTDGTVVQYTNNTTILFIKCFNHNSANYISITEVGYDVDIFNESLTKISGFAPPNFGISSKSIAKITNKLIVTGADYNGEVCIIDITDILNPIPTTSRICAQEAVGAGDNILLTNRKYTNPQQSIFVKNSILEPIDNMMIQPTTLVQNKRLDYDEINDNIIAVIATTSSHVINIIKLI